MDPVKLDEIRKKRTAELRAQLEELKSKLKKRKLERSLPGAKVTDGAPNKLSEMCRRLPFAPDAATATVAMDPVKLDEIRKKRTAELRAQLVELRSKLKKRKLEPSLPGAKVTDGAPNKLSEMEKLRPFLAEVVKKTKAELREQYSNREPLIARFNSQQVPCWTASSARDFVMIPG